MNSDQQTDLAPARRIPSIDALRGLVIFTMIYVNDVAGAPSRIVPAWMRHFHGRGSGMTFVDLVFPAFLFVVGMSVPFALTTRQARGARLPLPANEAGEKGPSPQPSPRRCGERERAEAHSEALLQQPHSGRG
jgi:uncharacterized membrane protein